MRSSYMIAVIIVNFLAAAQINMNAKIIPNLVDSLSKFIYLKPNETIHKLCELKTGQLCAYYGYKSESFTVTTADGYILRVFRCYRTITQKQPVLLVHGLLDSSDTWVMNPGNKSLAYNYVERGYDVYLLNCRGNRYSQRHITLLPQHSAFWNFSYQEMARYDLPATIDAILKRTGAATIQYVGHSQGGASVLGLLAIKPQYNQIITHAALLAPYTFKSHTAFPMNIIYKVFYKFGYNKYGQFLPHTLAQNVVSETVCKIFDGQLCNLFLNFLLGTSYDQLDGDMMPVYVSHFPAGASSKQFSHFGQEIHCKYFGEFMEIEPPFCQHPLPNFNLSSITTALSLFYSPTDPHTQSIDIAKLEQSLKNANLATKTNYQYNHMDFVWGKNAAKDVYDDLIARAQQFTGAIEKSSAE